MKALQWILAFAILAGPGILAVAVLWSGWRKAQSTAAVIAYAAGAGLLFGVHLFILFFWSMSASWSDGGRSYRVLMVVAAAAILLELAFLVFALPRTQGKPRGPIDGARIAAVIAVIYAGFHTMIAVRYGASITSGIVIAVALAVVLGLWRHAAWGWYAGVAAGAYSLAQVVWFAFVPWPRDLGHVLIVSPQGLFLVLLVSFLGVLLFTNARERCLRKATP